MSDAVAHNERKEGEMKVCFNANSNTEEGEQLVREENGRVRIVFRRLLPY